MKSAMLKDILREIGKTKSRFFSIFAIIALGAGFFAGLKATCPDMLETLERYYEEHNLMDIRLVSTYGFDENDISAIGDMEGIKDIYPSYSKDVFVENELGENIIAKVMALPDKGVNEVMLIEGRLPENANECVVEKHEQLHVVHEIGDTITVYTTDRDDPIGDTLENETFEVVGIVMSPQYISFSKGSSTIGDGTVDTYIMIPEENFRLEVFTEVYVTLDSTKGLGGYSDEYAAAVEASIADFEAVAAVREPERLKEVQEDAKAELEKAKKEIADAEAELAEAEAELAEAYDELKKGEREITNGWAEYEDGLVQLEEGRKQLEEQLMEAEMQLISARAQINSGWEEYEAGKAQLEDGKAQFEQLLAPLGISVDQMYSYKSYLEEQIAKYKDIPFAEIIVAGYQSQLAILNNVLSSYDQILAGEAELKAAYDQLKAGEAQISSGWAELEEGRKQGEAELEKAAAELENGKAELEKAEKEIKDGWAEYYDGLEEFEKAKEEAEEEIDSAKEDISEAEKEIAGIKGPTWYVFTREDNPSYSNYEDDVYIIESVGKVFPVFFFLVAMLVCLTTMTRMVEEQRTQIGTMKALGYGKGAIMAKFIAYSAIASISGAVFGIALCVIVFPEIIYSAYAMMYVVPDLIHVPTVGVWIGVTAVSILCTTAAVMMACYAELKECPAELMRPKAPKAGKRVLLEKVTFIWKRLSFTHKVTVRNLFRYKKRIFMTILGIAGCAALTLAGFGLYSSISVILEKQYSEIFNYDLIVALDTDAGKKAVNEVMTELDKNDISEENLGVYMMTAEYKGISEVSLVVTDDPEAMGEMVLFRERESGEIYELDDEGVIITELFAELADLSVGDDFEFYCDGVLFETKVSAVAENYAMHFIYMTDKLYTRLSKDDMKPNMVFTVMSDDGHEAQDELANDLMALEGVLAVSFSRTTRETFSDTVKNLNYVVILIILCAAALAFVVLYNLTNINITERIREIATIKVLGFYDGEVSAYVFRENVVLTLMGAAVGLVLGIWLHSFVLDVIQTNNIMFGKGLPWWTYCAAFVMTVFFAVLVNWIMYFRLKKVSMVESLKSVE
ncbi:MAG: FtsX-like permease family protein [Oscillospiraceae bacterium]|nr:FtsX-like permease family protein [Oscillospiraceae bacterium]